MCTLSFGCPMSCLCQFQSPAASLSILCCMYVQSSLNLKLPTLSSASLFAFLSVAFPSTVYHPLYAHIPYRQPKEPKI